MPIFRYGQTTSRAERIAARHIPKGARLVPSIAGATIYTYETAGRLYALAFRGSAAKPEWHHSFRTTESRDEHISQFVSSVQHSQDYRAKRRAERSAWVNPLKAGDVLYTSWGYDQTNVDFYVVTRVRGRRTWIRPCAAESEASGFMQARVKAILPPQPTGAETMHVAQPSGERGAYIKVSNSANAYLDTPGRTHHSSSYA